MSSANQEMTRREFGRVAGAVALGVAVAGAPSASARRSAVAGGKSAVVVGAGLAGLATAYELKRAGFKVTVMEARPRLGGRVRTIRTPFLGGQYAEAGGEYIDTGHKTFLHYAQRFGLQLQDVRKAPKLPGLIFRDHQPIRESAFITAPVASELDRYDARLKELAAKIDIDDPLASSTRSFDDRSLKGLLDELELSSDARWLIEQRERDRYTVEPEKLSLLFRLFSERVSKNQSDAGTQAYRVSGGNDRLVEQFFKHLRRSIVLRTPVKAVELMGDRVRVTAADGRTIDADYCVVTAPLPALRTVKFTPALTEQQNEAIDQLQYGSAAKTLLQYTRRFWRYSGLSGDTRTDLDFQSSWEATDRQERRRGILIAYTAGKQAKQVSELSEIARIHAIRKQLEEIYPRSIDRLVRAATVTWNTEPYSGGCHLAYAPGQMADYFDAFTHSQFGGRLIFAGEHTSNFTGYMEGALHSGRKAAIDIATGRT